MKAVVLDTSALLRLYLADGPIPQGLIEAIQAAQRAEITLYAPELLLAEVAQVLWKKEQTGVLSANETAQIRHSIAALPIRLAGHAALLEAAVALARLHRLTVYDALFLALTHALSGQLLTADEHLARAAARM